MSMSITAVRPQMLRIHCSACHRSAYVLIQTCHAIVMNLSHIITEFSFGPFFPDITQPLDMTYEVTHDRESSQLVIVSRLCSPCRMNVAFVAYQYFLHVVPTTYIAPRTAPLHTNQYSVTHYTRVLQHNVGTPGIFFKFDLDPLAITIHQKTTTFLQLIIRLA